MHVKIMCLLGLSVVPDSVGPRGPTESSVRGIFQARVLEWVHFLLQSIAA